MKCRGVARRPEWLRVSVFSLPGTLAEAVDTGEPGSEEEIYCKAVLGAKAHSPVVSQEPLVFNVASSSQRTSCPTSACVARTLSLVCI